MWGVVIIGGNGHWPPPGMHRLAAASTALSSGEPSTTQSAVFQPSQLYGGAYSLGAWWENHLLHPSSLHGKEGSSFQV